MRLDQATVVIRPRSVAGVCDLAFRFVFALAGRLYAWLFVVVLLPGLVGAAILRYGLETDWFPIWVLVGCYAVVFEGVFTVAASRLMFAKLVSLKDVLLAFRGRLLVTAGVGLTSRLLTAVLLPLFGAGLYFWLRHAYVFEAILLENADAGQATARSSAFAKEQLGTVFMVQLLLLSIQLGFVVGFELLGRGVVEFWFMMPETFEPLRETGGSPYALLGYFCSVPFTATARFLAYIDGRTRSDGWDLQVAFMTLASQGRKGESE